MEVGLTTSIFVYYCDSVFGKMLLIIRLTWVFH